MPERPPDPALERSTNRWMGSGLVFMLIMVLAFPLYRLVEPQRRDDAAAERSSELAAQGEELYGLACSNCHGEAGQGGAGSPTLNAQEFLQSAADEQIESLIATGVPGTTMSAYSLDFGGPFTREQIVALTVYLRSLEPDAPSVPNWQAGEVAAASAPETTVAEGTEEPDAGDTPTEENGQLELTQEIIDLGARTYEDRCASCHGIELEGSLGPALGAGSATETLLDGDIISITVAGRGSMPGFSSSLTSEEIFALVAYLRTEQDQG